MLRVVLALAFLAIAQVASLSVARRDTTIILARLPDKEPAHKGGPQLGAKQADELDPSDSGADSPNSPVLTEEQKVAQTDDDIDPSDGGGDSPNSPVAAEKVVEKISKDEGKVTQDDDEYDPSDGGGDSPNSPVAAEKVVEKTSKDESKVTQDDDEYDPSDGGGDSPNSPVAAEKVVEKISKDKLDDDQGEDEGQDEDLSYQDSIEVPMEIPVSIPRYGMDDKDAASAPETPATQDEKDVSDETESKEAAQLKAKEAAAQEGEQKAPAKAAIDGKKEQAIDVNTLDQKLAGAAAPYKPNWIEGRARSKNQQGASGATNSKTLTPPSPSQGLLSLPTAPTGKATAAQRRNIEGIIEEMRTEHKRKT